MLEKQVVSHRPPKNELQLLLLKSPLIKTQIGPFVGFQKSFLWFNLCSAWQISCNKSQSQHMPVTIGTVDMTTIPICQLQIERLTAKPCGGPFEFLLAVPSYRNDVHHLITVVEDLMGDRAAAFKNGSQSHWIKDVEIC